MQEEQVKFQIHFTLKKSSNKHFITMNKINGSLTTRTHLNKERSNEALQELSLFMLERTKKENRGLVCKQQQGLL
jgi:hypothetical protein